ncbi:PRC-barrel domain-containing protein [Paracoccus thiocyanatus]|uniref:Photosystem reaction center subunit H n=1 Tax=Paracoccus thiocyanatus TaxID=34006 RepID=A0A3D8P9S2_9RHOB|nr:PRC-barrel domain-containing protein [Paracoccus thiocyanatus]RDW12826.1 photosystem reaction center subunit H [Paracoccus thiocyanatus]
MDHSTHTRLTEQELTEATLVGATVYGPGDEKIGEVSHVHGSGAEARVVVDVGGFLGIGSKPVAVAARDLDFMRGETVGVHALTRWTKDELKDMPAHRHG